MYLIVGLGNPGDEYASTRHNLGFMVIQRLIEKLGVTALKQKFSAFMTSLEYSGRKVILAMPQTFMNRSGDAVAQLLAWHKIDPRRMILIYDDADLEVGGVRLRQKGSAAGHKGVESVIAAVSSQEFIRVRIGIGRDKISGDISDYVLSPIPRGQLDKMEAAIERAAELVLTVIECGVEATIAHQNRPTV